MAAPTVLWSSLLVLTGALPAPQGKTWDPTFDYTNLPPSNDQYWAPLGGAQVSLEEALKVAAEAEGMPLRVLSVELALGETPSWSLQVVGTGDPEHPRRVNMSVSLSAPEVVRRLELQTLAPDEVPVWESLREATLPPDVALQLAADKVRGNRPDDSIENRRARKIEYVPDAKPLWRCEVMGLDTKQGKVRRYEIEVSATDPRVRRKLLLDRFVGEPLRAKGEATELENGLFVYDFEVGDGAVVERESKVRVNYRLFLLDGSKFHDTWHDKREETFLVSKAPLKGMTEGLVGMRVGSRRKIAIPYPLAFGEEGNELAPRRAMVVCDIQVEGLIEGGGE